jgi:hypothetical protein
MFFSVDGERSRIYSVGTSNGGLHQRFFSIDGGRSWINSSVTSQGVHGRCFLALMVDAPGSTATAPPREPAIDVLQQGGSRSGPLAMPPMGPL